MKLGFDKKKTKKKIQIILNENEKCVKNEIVKEITNASWTMIHGWIDRNDDKSMIKIKMNAN